MHDIKRDDIFKKASPGQKHKRQDHSNNKEHSHKNKKDHKHEEHRHNGREHQEHKGHSHEDTFSGHNHEHDEIEEHLHHDHRHEERFESRAYNHVHDHSHRIFHAHHHKHNPEEDSIIHRVFNNPLRDWFALFFMSILLLIHQTVQLNNKLSDGILIVIIVTGLSPLLKNAFFDGIVKKLILPELIAAIFLLGLIFSGELLTGAIITIFIFLGSFLNLNFSWK